MSEPDLFHRMQGRFPTRGGFATILGRGEVLSQEIRDGVMTHRWAVVHDGDFPAVSIYELKARIEPAFELLAVELIIAHGTRDHTEAEEHRALRSILTFEWADFDGVRLPAVLHRDSWSSRQNAEGESVSLKARVTYQRQAFEDLSKHPPQPADLAVALPIGAQIHDDRGSQNFYEDDLHFTVGERTIQWWQSRIELDDPLMVRPQADLPERVYYSTFHLSRTESIGSPPDLRAFEETGGAGDSARAAMREHAEARPGVDSRFDSPEQRLAQQQAFTDWNLRTAELIGELWRAEPDAPELPQLLPYRWKYAPLIDAIDVEAELHAWRSQHPDDAATAMAGDFWRLAAKAVAPTTPDTERAILAGELAEMYPDAIALGAHLHTLAWMATDDPIAAEELQRHIATAYIDTYQGRRLQGILRKADAVGEPVVGDFTDIMTSEGHRFEES